MGTVKPLKPPAWNAELILRDGTYQYITGHGTTEEANELLGSWVIDKAEIIYDAPGGWKTSSQLKRFRVREKDESFKKPVGTKTTAAWLFSGRFWRAFVREVHTGWHVARKDAASSAGRD
jgi:hypothetical protein